MANALPETCVTLASRCVFRGETWLTLHCRSAVQPPEVWGTLELLDSTPLVVKLSHDTVTLGSAPWNDFVLPSLDGVAKV